MGDQAEDLSHKRNPANRSGASTFNSRSFVGLLDGDRAGHVAGTVELRRYLHARALAEVTGLGKGRGIERNLVALVITGIDHDELVGVQVEEADVPAEGKCLSGDGQDRDPAGNTLTLVVRCKSGGDQSAFDQIGQASMSGSRGRLSLANDGCTCRHMKLDGVT